MDDDGRKMGHARTPLFLAIFAASVMLMSGIATPASATKSSIEPGAIHVERKDAAAGSTLAWDWQASSNVFFSISRSLDAATVLYSSEGKSNSSSLSISTDDTYLLLWENPGAETVTLTSTVSVDAGSGPVITAILVAIVLIVVLVSIFYIVKSRDRARRAKEMDSPKAGISESQVDQPVNQSMGGLASPYQRQSSAQPPAPVGPISAGGLPPTGPMISCPYCNASIQASSRFCAYCSGKIQ